jgi:hypothetical protein
MTASSAAIMAATRSSALARERLSAMSMPIPRNSAWSNAPMT